jgi:thioredoxin reductase
LLIILAPAGYSAGQELDSEGYTKAIVNKFTKILQMAQSLDSEQYTGVVADKFKELLANVQKLEAERHKYAERMTGMFKKLRG